MAAELIVAATGEVLDDTQALAHIYIRGGDPHTALCGKQLIGIPAPDDADTCIVCEDLARQRWATHRREDM